jgi:hypothetical protein
LFQLALLPLSKRPLSCPVLLPSSLLGHELILESMISRF